MTTASTLWVINCVLFVLTLVTLRDVIGPRRGRMRRHRREVTGQAMSPVLTRPAFNELYAVWQKIIPDEREPRHFDDWVVDYIAILAGANDRDVGELRRVCNKYVNALNRLAEYIDEGLIRPKDIVRSYPIIHEELLRELYLVEPFIWFESILKGRGRWGYRPAQLRLILESLRPASHLRSLCEARSIHIKHFTLMTLPQIGDLKRRVLMLPLLLRSPTITLSSKIRQAERRDAIASTLQQNGLNGPPDQLAQIAVEW